MKNVLIIYHSTNLHGPINLYESFLNEMGHETTSIIHPLDSYEGRFSEIKKSGKLISKYPRSSNYIINLIIDFVLTLYWIQKFAKDVSTVVAGNNFDALAAIFARSIFFKKYKIIYFASDYSSSRFRNSTMNWIYMTVEKICLRYSHLTISNTHRAKESRLKIGLDKTKSIVIPNAVRLEDPNFKPKPINKRHFIYVGNVTIEHGLLDLLNVLTEQIDFLVVIGDGPQWDELKNFCIAENLNYELHRNKPHEFVIDYMQRFDGLGLAPYNSMSSWTYYCSPLKVVEYVSCGLPVLMSSLPEIADVIKKHELGVVYDLENIDQLISSLKDFRFLNFESKAESFYNMYDYKILYKRIAI